MIMYLGRDKKNNWEVRFYYKDYTGKRKQKHKTGFKTKKEAQQWAEEFKVQQAQNLDMTFQSFWELYRDDQKERLRENTMRTKDYIVELKILPYFGAKKMVDITPADIRRWQNSLMKGDKFSPTYLKTINNQLNAIFNYAVKYYSLPRNPCTIAGSIGKSNADEMQYWTLEEFEDFLSFVKDKPQTYYAFKVLFWTGLRIGELLALNLEDFDPVKRTLTVNKSYQRIKGRDVITEPKTAKGNRVISLPGFIVEDLNNYVGMLYGIMPTDRLFNVTKSYLEHEMKRGCELSGTKKIRLHDLRHSHATLLISQLGMQPNLVAARLGHEKIQTTLNTYAHLYPEQNRMLADRLDELMESGDDDTDEKEGE
jgi:integrase